MAGMRVGALLLGLFVYAAGAAAQEPSVANLPSIADIAVRGRVLGPRGTPVANARIELHPVLSRSEAGVREVEGKGPATISARTTADPDGRFVLRAPEPGMWRIVAAAEGFVPQQRLLIPLLEETELLPVELPVDSGLRVRVLSQEGAPVAGARVLGDVQSRFPTHAPGGWTPVERKGRSGADGVVHLPKTAAETLRLQVSAPGFPVQEGPTTMARAAAVRLRGKTAAGADPAPPRSPSLPSSAPLSGRIVDRHTRAPLPGALVWPEGDPGRWVRAEADGTFRLPNVAAPLESGLAAAALGHAPGVLSLQGVAPRDPLVLALAPAATLRGTVVDARGRPLANAELSLSLLGGPTGENRGEKESHAARTSTDGVFQASGLRTGASYLVTAHHPGFAPASTPVALPKLGSPIPDLRLVLGRGRTAVGRVMDESGRPVAGVPVELLPGAAGRVVASDRSAGGDVLLEAHTGADGKFELRHLPGGWFRVRIEAGGFLAFEREGLQIPVSAARADFGRFVLQRGAAFRGWAGDPDGAPLAGAEVWIIPAEVHDWTELYAQGPAAVTGPDGTFVVPDLSREDSFGLDICRAGYLPLSVTVREISGEPFRAILRPAAAISGRVLDQGGAPVPSARIESWLSGDEPSRSESIRPCRSGSGSARSDGDGRFRFDALPPGWWNLRATAPGHRGATRGRLHVPAGGRLDGVEIVLSPGAFISGRVFTSGGEPAPGAQVSALSEEGTLQTVAGGDGSYRLAGVEPGERTIEATLGEGTWASRSLTVLPGDNRLDLTMDQGAPHQEIRGRVLGPDGGPVAGATVLAGGVARTVTAPDGAFLLAVEDNREYEIWAEKERFAAARAETAVRVAGSPVAGVEIRLGRGGTLTGQILGLDREELARASVEVDLLPPFQARAAVDPQGGYQVENIPPGEWTVTARAGDRTVRERAVLPPDASNVAVDLAFEPSHEVSGQISGPAGEPVAEAYIRFFAPGGASGNTYSRSDGSFHLRLEDGSYRVVARREGYLWTAREEPVAVESAPVSGLELHLDEAAVIRGRILGLDPGERARAVWASTGAPNGNRREGQLDQEDGFVIPDVPPGDWIVTVEYGGRAVSVSLHLDPGQQEQWVEVEMGER